MSLHWPSAVITESALISSMKSIESTQLLQLNITFDKSSVYESKTLTLPLSSQRHMKSLPLDVHVHCAVTQKSADFLLINSPLQERRTMSLELDRETRTKQFCFVIKMCFGGCSTFVLNMNCPVNIVFDMIEPSFVPNTMHEKFLLKHRAVT